RARPGRRDFEGDRERSAARAGRHRRRGAQRARQAGGPLRRARALGSSALRRYGIVVFPTGWGAGGGVGMAQTKIAIYPGSFDPITNGHVDLVKRTLGVFDRVVVAIARNPDKERTLFDLDERLEMIRQVFKGFGDRVAAESFDGLLVDYAKKSGA